MTQQKALESRILEVLTEAKAQNLISIAVAEQTTVTDYMIIATGQSSRHVRAIAQILMTTLKSEGVVSLHDAGLEAGEWALVDFGDAVVHIMQQDIRAFYDLEGLWNKA